MSADAFSAFQEVGLENRDALADVGRRWVQTQSLDSADFHLLFLTPISLSHEASFSNRAFLSLGFCQSNNALLSLGFCQSNDNALLSLGFCQSNNALLSLGLCQSNRQTVFISVEQYLEFELEHI